MGLRQRQVGEREVDPKVRKETQVEMRDDPQHDPYHDLVVFSHDLLELNQCVAHLLGLVDRGGALHLHGL